MSNALPTRDEIKHSITETLPEWRRHQRCLPGQRCRSEWGEWMDVLLEELHLAITASVDTEPADGLHA